MNQNTIPVVPKINDAYWFKYSEELLASAQQKRESAAAAIQKLVVWLWGIYTASAAVGFTLSGKELSFWPAAIIAAASGALIIVYWGTVWVQVPVKIEFDPRSPTEIESAYNKSVDIKSKRLSITLFASVIAAIMVSFALIIASVNKPVKHDYSDISTSIIKIEEKSVISITAWVGETKMVSITATQLLQDNKQGKSIESIVLPTKEGLIQTSLEMQAKTVETILLELKWITKAGHEITIRKKLEDISK
jgi:hypothetical protein